MATQTSPKPSASSKSAARILRLGVIQNGRIIEERLIRNRAPVSIGENPKNTFTLIGDSVPKSYTVFDVRQDQYVLRFDKNMSGRLTVGSAGFDLQALRDSGKAKQEGDVWAVAIDERSRGKISLGEITVLFQFVNAPPLRMAPSLPSHIRGGPVQFFLSNTGLQGAFLLCLGMSALFQVASAWYLINRVPPPPRPSLADAVEQLVAILRDPIVPPEDIDMPEEVADEGTSDEVAEEEIEEEVEEERPEPQERPQETPPPQSGDAVREQVREQVATGTAIGSLITGAGPGAALPGGGPIDVNAAMRDISGQVGQGTAGGITSNTGLGTNDGVGTGAERVGVVEQNGSSLTREAGSAGGEEATGREVTVRARIRGADIQARGSGTLDQDQLSSYLQRQQRRLQQCYERELARNPSISGRVQIQFTVDGSGSVTDARIPNSELPDSVDNCILTEVRRWQPGRPEGGSVTIRRTYLFENGG
jgi:TonB family protein